MNQNVSVHDQPPTSHLKNDISSVSSANGGIYTSESPHDIKDPKVATGNHHRFAALLAVAVTLVMLWVPSFFMHHGTANAEETDESIPAQQMSSDMAKSGSAAPASEPIAGPVPNVIITNFNYGNGPVAIGSNFNLVFTYQNKGQVAIQNMVITVDGGDMLAISGGTNTFYVSSLSAGHSLSQTVPMQALADAKSGAQGVTIHFAYEYVQNNQRSSASADIKVSVPLSQPTRMQINDPVIPEQVRAGEETTITLAYVNKGKGDIANLEATMEGEGFKASVPTQYLGNVASGGNGSIGYLFTPQKAGKLEAKFKVSYEDSDGKAQSKEYPISMNVGAKAEPANMTVSEELPKPNPLPFLIIAAVVLILVIALIVVLVRRHRKKKKAKLAAEEDDDDWDDDISDDNVAALNAGNPTTSYNQNETPANTPTVNDNMAATAVLPKTQPQYSDSTTLTNGSELGDPSSQSDDRFKPNAPEASQDSTLTSDEGRS
ncbi:ABC transporter permease [Bifidobacterium sp. ESL0775]|uniref:COG1361 S-layer family protein n=1 Tax=Bifidobacterium sp. ESL0775 TaxID=2983230 RepID=UPI0023F73321|nr:ABC transporter permease [Bifidobacterium sp. ESL0775]WEV69909.1 ABC transporter permease [Bifidobacterium sp. ESL0775]